MSVVRTLAEGARLSVGLKPRTPANYSGWGTFALLCLLHVVSSALYTLGLFGEEVVFDPNGLQSEGLDLLLTLLAAMVLARLFKRAAFGLALANLMLGALWLAELYFQLLRDQFDPPAGGLIYSWQFWLWIAAMALITHQALRWLRPDGLRWQRLGAAFSFALLSNLFWSVLTPQYFWAYAPPDESDLVEPPLAFNPERVMFEQAARIGTAVRALNAQRPGQTDLYLLTFGADGAENVFRNEAEFVGNLFAQRFGAEGRVLSLINNPSTAKTTPLATVSNLRYALKLLEDKLDPAEDILMVFVTTHGSEDHWLAVDLAPLPLNPLSAKALGRMLKQSPFENQVVIISACYSGGFLPELKREGSLVITAARSDRPSFGCGPDADITYFGRAFFANALNQTDSFLDAFKRAQVEVTRREKELKADPSEPQLLSNPTIEAKLREWRQGFTLGAPLAFENPANCASAAPCLP